MMTVSLPLYLLLLANAALIVAAAFAVMRVERALHKSSEFWTSPTGAAMCDKSTAPAPAGNDRLALQLKLMQQSINDLKHRVEDGRPDRSTDLPVQHAVRMVKRGANVDELADTCGLSLGEAELLRRLHGKRQAAATSGRG